MHELSIAMSVVDIAAEYAGKENATVVKEIEIEVGELSGVVLEALEFALESAVQNTLLQDAERKIIVIPGKARCTNCSHVFETNDLFAVCPKCRTCAPDIVEGKELRIKSMIVE